MIEEKLRAAVRDVPDFPKPGILFKDITPILQDPVLCEEVVAYFANQYKADGIDAVLGVESRGFLFGPGIAQKLGVPFIPVRKKGKLPSDVIAYTYDLEYGSATVEIHRDAIKPGMKVLVHDDLLATGGTAIAASELVKELGGEVKAFGFLIELSFLDGKKKLESYADSVQSIISY